MVVIYFTLQEKSTKSTSEHSTFADAVSPHTAEALVLISITNHFSWPRVVAHLIMRLLHARGQFCHSELRKWCDALLILRQASSGHYLYTVSCTACSTHSNNLLPRSSAFKMHIPLSLQLLFMCYVIAYLKTVWSVFVCFKRWCWNDFLMWLPCSTFT